MGSQRRVLVVDDDSSIRRLVCTLIQREGIEVHGVPDGQAAIEALQSRPYHIILLDLMMPRLDGFGVIQHLKESAQEPKPVVFVVTAYGDFGYKQVDSDIVAGVIHKPFDVTELSSLIRQLVNHDRPDTREVTQAMRERALREFDRSVHWVPSPPGSSRGSGHGSGQGSASN